VNKPGQRQAIARLIAAALAAPAQPMAVQPGFVLPLDWRTKRQAE
jgi:hypothetical protein